MDHRLLSGTVMNRLSFAIFLFTAMFCAASEIPTNVELASLAVDDAAARIVEKFNLSADTILVFEATGDGEAGRFVTGKLAARLSEKFRLETNPSPGISKLSVSVVRAVVSYDHQERQRFWSRAWLTRRAEIALLCRFDDSRGRIQAEEIVATRSDRISLMMLESVEQDGIIFGKPKSSAGGWLSNWFEPILASAVTGIVVYLFFHIRSE